MVDDNALLEVNNRGGKAMLRFFDHAEASNDPTTAAQFDDRFFVDAGCSLEHAPVRFGRDRRRQADRRSGAVGFNTTLLVHQQPLAHPDHVAHPPAELRRAGQLWNRARRRFCDRRRKDVPQLFCK